MFFLTEACGLDVRTMNFIMAGSPVANGVTHAVVGACWRGSDMTTGCLAIAAAMLMLATIVLLGP